MARTSASKTALPAPGRRALKALGHDTAVARKRRRLPQQLLADRMLVSRQTVQRLEAGDPTVSLGILASAFFMLGFTPRLETLLAPKATPRASWRTWRDCPGARTPRLAMT